MRHVPEKYFKSRDSTSVKQMSRTVCGGGPGERGTINREVDLRELLGAQQTSALGVGMPHGPWPCRSHPSRSAALMPFGSSSMSSVAVALNFKPHANSCAATWHRASCA
jgi:hypothetical protein